jgi:hypothetical protein
MRRPLFRSGLALSVMLHVLVVGSLVRLANLAPAPTSFDVFAADPVDAAPPHTVVRSAPAPPRPHAAPPTPKRPPVASPRAHASAPPADVSARSAPPPDLPVASRATASEPLAAVSVSAPSVVPGDTEVQLALPPASADEPQRPVSRQFAADAPATIEPPQIQPIETLPGPVTAPRADVLGPVPATPLTAVTTVPTVSVLETAALEQQPAESAPPAPAAMPKPTPPPVPRRDPEPSGQASAGPPPEPPPPPRPPIRIQTVDPVAPSTPTPAIAVDNPRPPMIARAAPVVPPRSDSSATGGSSPLGLGLGRLRIRLDGASLRTTDRDVDVISGTLVGGQPQRLLVQVDEHTSEPKLEGRLFTTTVKLVPGINRVRVLATDAAGAEVEEVVTVQFVPRPTPDVAITNPRDGHTLAPDDPPLVVVQGQVSDPGLTTVWIVANDLRMMVPVTAGRFRHVVPVVEPTVRVRAETASEGRRSATVTVHAAATVPALALFVGDWPRDTAGPTQVTVTWRPNPAKLEGGAQTLRLNGLADDGGAGGGDFYYLRDARPGVYTFSLTYRAGAPAAIRPLLYVAGAPRSLQPVTLDGAGRAVVARLLLPQGVLWDQDDWFTGRSGSGDTVTKFRFPDGVSWTERRGDLGR